MTVSAAERSAIASVLAREVGVEVTEATVVHDGLNRSIAVSTAETERAYVARIAGSVRDRETFNSIEREYDVLQALDATSIRAPAPVAICPDESLLGDPFLVMTHLDGEPIPLGNDLPERYRRPAARERFAVRLVETLAELHAVDVEPFLEVCDRRPLRDQVDRVVDQFDDAARATGEDWPRLRRVAEWLRANAPAEAGPALVHGDFRPGNVLVTGDDLEIAGVLDWETAFVGDPLVELGYLLLRWRDDGDPIVPIECVRTEPLDDDVRADLESMNERGLAPYTSDAGSPDRRELVRRYEPVAGRTFEHERFYRAFATFILATVWADLYRLQVEAGEPTSRGPYIEYLAVVATQIVDGEFEL